MQQPGVTSSLEEVASSIFNLLCRLANMIGTASTNGSQNLCCNGMCTMQDALYTRGLGLQIRLRQH